MSDEMNHGKPNEYDQEMEPDEFARANFFSSTEELGPVKAQEPQKRLSRKRDPCSRALAVFVRALETQTPNARRAAILWLADRYLGMKPRHWVP